MTMDRETERRPLRERSSGQLGRLAGMFLSPGAVFESIAVAPTVAAALVATSLAGALGATAVSRAADVDAMARFAFERQQEAMPGLVSRNMSDADRERAFEAARTGLRISRNFAPIIGAIGGAAAPLVASAALLLGFGVLGASGSYRTILSTVTHAWWPAAATSSVLTAVVVWTSWPMAPERAAAPLRTSLAALVPDADRAAAAFAGRVELFLGWEIALLGIGLATTLGVSRKLSFGAATALWALATAAAVGVAAATRFIGFTAA